MFRCVQFILLLLICTPFCKCENTTEISETKEIILDADSWLLRRFTKIKNGEKTDTKFRLTCDSCFNPNEWSGLKIDIYFFHPVERIKEDYPIKFKPATNQISISLPDISKLKEGDLIYDFKVYFKDNFQPKVEEIVKSFYVNEVLKFGAPQEINNEQHIRTISARKQCSSFIRSLKVFDKTRSNITVQHKAQKNFEGLTLILIFQQDFKAVKINGMRTSKQEGNQWSLQNFGLNGKANEDVTGVIELEAPELVLDPNPLAIIFNGEILCGLPPIDIKQGTAVVSFLDFIGMVKLNERNHSLHIVSIVMISFLALVIIGGAIFILYMCKKWRFYSSNFVVNPQQNLETKPKGHFNQKNTFDDFVTADAEYENI